jgi:formylglycine-generating enzyme required for sulfatase activity/predicted phosphodiesterase
VASGASAPDDTIAWAHLSDFHFKAGQDYGRDEVLTALIEDLEMFAGKREAARGAEPVPLDFVVVTGDIAQSGKDGEYRQAAAFFAKVAEATGVPADRFFPVPGNHDVDRDADALEPMRQSPKARELFEEAWKKPAKRRSMFKEKLAAYRQFSTTLNPSLRIPEEQPGGFCQTLDCRGRAVAVLGLGSSWLCGQEREQGLLITGREQAYELAGGVRLESLAGADLKLVLMHHPLDWMLDRSDMSRLLADHADILLRGHLHETGVEWLATPGRELRTIAAGSAYDGSRYRNAYNVVRVTFETTRQVKVWLRAYAAGERRFVRDVETYARADDGTWTWDLAGGVRAAPAVVPGRPAAVDVGPYLRKLRDENRWLDVRGIGAKAAERTELERVYTRLRVAGAPTLGGPDSGRKTGKGVDGASEDLRRQDLELRDILRDDAHVVLVGDPGSGKTTFLRFVVLNLAKAHLDEDRAASLERLGLSGRPPFPVFVRLGLLGQFLANHPGPAFPDESPAHFHRYLEFSLKGFSVGLPEDYIPRRVREGGVLLLLDGLDEVPSQRMRERVGAILDHVVAEGKERGSRHLVTCRTRAYQEKVQLGADFTRYQLVDFGEQEVEQFVTQWARSLFRVAPGEEGTAAANQAAGYRGELLSAIRAHPHVLPLTYNPLLLTILAVVHWNRKKLPEQRADLYEAALEYLLESREKLSAYETTLRKDCLKAIALRMFEDAKGVRKSLGRGEAAEAVRPLLGVDLDRAHEFIEDEELYSGILVSRTEGEAEFWHPTFGEYLAAVALARKPDYWERIRQHLFEERWNEAVLLLAGCRRRDGLELASDFIRRILAADASLAGRARAVGLVGRILRDVSPAGGDPAQGTGYRQALAATLAIFEKGRERVPEPVRVEVGEALGQAGDPRISDDDQANRVLIRGGTFWMGAQRNAKTKPGYDNEADDDEAPVHRVTLSDFWIDRYPVTVQQFRRFVDAGSSGYLDVGVWSGEGWALREKAERSQPSGWEEQIRHPNRPVVYVTWHEADAYCRWLAKRTGQAVQLPTEAQWEYAARGEKGRKFPWDDAAPTDQHANFAMNVGHATPVGIYPLGATAEGVQDMAGNVWEWCRDWLGSYSAEAQADPVGPATGELRLLRGGGFDDVPGALRAASRLNGHPGGEYGGIGFRCVVAGAGGQRD